MVAILYLDGYDFEEWPKLEVYLTKKTKTDQLSCEGAFTP